MLRARGLAARTVGPAELIFGHKMYLWCRSGKGYIKNPNSKIQAPCWEFLIFVKNQEILIFRKSGQKGGDFYQITPEQKMWNSETPWLMYAKN